MLTEEPRTTAEPILPAPGPRPLPSPLQPGVELPPRRPPLPAQEQAARPAAPHRAARARAPRQADGARRVRLRQPLVVGVRHRGDPAGPHPRSRASARSSLVVPLTVGDARRPRLPDPVVPPDDQGLPHRGRRLHGDARQLRPASRAGRRGRAPHRLRAHRLGVGRGRYGRAGLGVQRVHAVHPPDLDPVRDHHRLREPARREGVGEDLRGTDLLLHGQHGRAARLGRLPAVRRDTCRRSTARRAWSRSATSWTARCSSAPGRT